MSKMAAGFLGLAFSCTSAIAASVVAVPAVFVSRNNGAIEEVTLGSCAPMCAHAVVGSTGVGDADSLVFDQAGTLLVSGNRSRNVFRMDPTLPGGAANTGTQVNTSLLYGLEAADEAIDASGANLYVTDYNGKTLSVVHLATGAVSFHTLSGMIGLSGIAFDPSGQLWVTDPYARTVGTVDLSANTYAPLCSGLPSGGAPDGLTFDPLSGNLFVSGREGNWIAQLTIGTNTCSVGTVYTLGTDSVTHKAISPDGIAADGLGNVFIAGQNGAVAQLDIASGIVTTIATGLSQLDDIAPIFVGPPPACPYAPTDGCFGAAKNSVSFKANPNTRKQKFSWTWSKGTVQLGPTDFGDPVNGSTTYQLCVYDDAAGSPTLKLAVSVPPGGTCGGKPCWKVVGRKGWSYKNKVGNGGGLIAAQLAGGAAGKPKLKVQGKGPNLSLPVPTSSMTFFNEDPAVIVQLHSTNTGNCWSSSFAASGTKKNDGDQFKAKDP